MSLPTKLDEECKIVMGAFKKLSRNRFGFILHKFVILLWRFVSAMIAHLCLGSKIVSQFK
jgi:hypothetical protein